jgi:[NiFe] hydrogenase large subunit
MGAQFQHDHIVHFYHLHALDWVDIVSALKADPKKTAALSDNVSKSPWGGASYFKEVQQRLQTFVDSGQLGPFANAYWGHPAYKLPPEANLMAGAQESSSAVSGRRRRDLCQGPDAGSHCRISLH